MRVLHFLGIGQVPKRPITEATGGSERVALEIARIQVRRGDQVTVASMAPAPWRGNWEGVDLRHLRPHAWARIQYGGRVTDFRTHLGLMGLVRSGGFDLVHLHEYRKTRFLGRRPKVMHFHNTPLDGTADADLAGAAAPYWRQLRGSDAQIAVSHFVGRRLSLLHEYAGAAAPPANVVVDQSGVDANLTPPERRRETRERMRRELGLREGDVLFLFAGAIRPEKGVVQLAQAFSGLAAERPDARLTIAGGSKLWVGVPEPKEVTEHQVRTILDEALAKQQASLLGIVSPATLSDHYAAADVLVLPSMFQEAFGLVILEAFAAGIPVIGFRSGGVPELVDDGRTGLLVDQGDVDGLRLAMRRLLLDREERERMGAAARTLAVEMTWENTVDRLERIYEDVVRRGA